MRVLFCFVGGPGHFEPMAPIARAARAAGHTVAVACGASRVAMVEAAGFPAVGIGPPVPDLAPLRTPLQEVDLAREHRDMREHFAGTAARSRADGVRAVALDWAPDVIVADEADFGAMIAAEAVGVPWATVLVIATGSLIRPEVVAGSRERVRAEHGLPPDPDLAAPGRYLVLNPFPPSLRDPAFPLPPTAHRFRPVEVHSARASPGLPTVYFTLGTEFNLESGDLFDRVVSGLRGLPVNVLVTVGRQIDPAALGPQPANVRIERYLPQSEVLPLCDLVVFHGGSGTLVGALAHGLPMAVIAMGADQPANAARCAALGVGVALDPLRVTPDEVAGAVSTVLADPAYRRAARRLQVEIAAQPEPAAAVALLDRLAVERRPVVAGGPMDQM